MSADAPRRRSSLPRARSSASSLDGTGSVIFFPRAPIELQLVGKTLLHAAAVGAAVGLVCSFFFAALELVEHLVLEGGCGYVALRARGEHMMEVVERAPFRPWLLCFVPAVGALLAGLVSWRLAPETSGGGTDAILRAFHHEGGVVRRRVAPLKLLASVLTLGSGGSGGREGPTMHIGGAMGAMIGRYLRVSDRERRVLLVAGTAAGMAAVFRTPLGAALLAVEVIHRDDFESDALVPSVLASVVAYSVFISFFGESTLFAHSAAYPFVPAHLPLYAAMAVAVSIVASVYVGILHGTQQFMHGLRAPTWLKPAIGGLALGAVATPIIYIVGPTIGQPGQGLGLLGGGYGAAQVAIAGASWLPAGWRGVELLLLLGVAKIVATSLTVGSGGSAGDFGPSLVVGGLFGGAFGRAAALLFHDPRIDPGAFALVGMATLYGGLAHVPIASLVMTCELAGSYDLLVPLMLAEGIAFVALRSRSLYKSQVKLRRDSPAHRDELILDVLQGVRVGDILVKDRPFRTFERKTPAAEVLRVVAVSEWQDAFPVLDAQGAVVGVITDEILRTMTVDPELAGFTLADDLMAPPILIRESSDLHEALELLLVNDIQDLVVVDDDGKIVGFLDEAEISRTYHRETRRTN